MPPIKGKDHQTALRKAKAAEEQFFVAADYLRTHMGFWAPELFDQKFSQWRDANAKRIREVVMEA